MRGLDPRIFLFVVPVTVIAGLDPAISCQRQMRGSSPAMTNLPQA